VDLTAAIRTAIGKVEPLSATQPLPVSRPGVLPKSCLQVVLAID